MTTNPNFTSLPIRKDLKERLRQLMEQHPSYYTSYQKILKTAIILLEQYSPATIFTVCTTPTVLVEMKSDENAKDRINKALDAEQKSLERDLRD